ncbi:MAG: beta-ketoacyl-ACP synthase III [Candidatus Methylacidiphilales bacterium]
MKIVGTGKYTPEHILTNADLEKKVDTSDEWIVTRTGIRERRIASERETSSFMGARAAEKALLEAGVSAAEVDLILVATVTPDATFPSTACYIQNEIGAKNAAAMDLQAACSGFLYGLVLASQFLTNGKYKNILVIGTEKLSSIIDWSDRNTCVLFGDGAGAALVQPARDGSKLLSYDLGADGTLHEILYLMNGHTRGPRDEAPLEGPHYMMMQGQEVFKKAVNAMYGSAFKVLGEAGLTAADIKCVIPHQANIRIIDAICDRLELPTEKRFINVQRYGNVSAACIPIALDEARSHYDLQPGDKILLVAFGGGLTWAAAVLEW